MVDGTWGFGNDIESRPQAISEMINRRFQNDERDGECFRPVADYIVGHGRRNEKHGMMPKEQIDKSMRFRDGHFNTLVSTSVVKEGIDVGSCRVGEK